MIGGECETLYRPNIAETIVLVSDDSDSFLNSSADEEALSISKGVTKNLG